MLCVGLESCNLVFMVYWTRILSSKNFMHLLQVFIKIFQFKHGHSDKDTKNEVKNE